MKIVILGEGSWGKALASLLAHNKKDFVFFEKGQKIQDGTVVISALPTQAIRVVLGEIKGAKDLIYINASKGIEIKTHKLPHKIAEEVLGKDVDYFTLIGPSFAQEVENMMPTLVSLGCISKKNTKLVRGLFQTDYFKIRLTESVNTLELWAAFKNVYAVACGLSTGLGFGANTRVKLILSAIDELNKLSISLGFESYEQVLPGTIGDLILTCSSEKSRNFSFGKALANSKIENALSITPGTVEGFYTAEAVPYFEKKIGFKLPLAGFVYDVIKTDDPSKIKSMFGAFVKRI